MTNQEGVHAAVRNVTATAGTYLEDWHALFTANSVAAGPFNERMLSFLNTNLGTSYARLTDAMNAFAISQGFAGWSDMNTFTLSEAAALLAAETQGLALVFTDDAFFARDGFYGSAEIKDTGTPANNYSASPVKAASSLLTYASPSPKLTRGPDGLYRYQAHNLCLQSEAFNNASWTKSGCTVGADAILAPNGTMTADACIPNAGTVDVLAYQTITTIVGATYSFRVWLKDGGLTDWVELTTSGGATVRSFFNLSSGTKGNGDGTITDAGDGWYLCEFPITAAHTSTVFYISKRPGNGNSGPITGDGTTVAFYAFGAHVRRTPSDPTYLATTSAARYDLPFEWDESGALDGLLVEEARTNLCLYSNDLTQSNWTKTSVSAAKTATGPDGVSNSASTLTASSANGGAFQRIVSASAARSGAVHLKRRTGTGAVSVAIGETTGSTLVTNGTFTGNITGWTATSTGTGTFDYDPGTGNRLRVIRVDGSNIGRGYQAVSVTAGKFYRVQATNASDSGGPVNLRLGTTNDGDEFSSTAIAVNTTVTQYVLATGTTLSVGFLPANNGTTNYVDDVTVFEVVESTVDLSSGNWVRGSIENKTITNPCVAIKLATSGDAVDVAYADMETGAFITSPIETFGSSVTRAVDQISLAATAFPVGESHTLYVEYAPTTGSVQFPVLILKDATNYFAWRRNNATDLQAEIQAGGVAQANITPLSVPVGTTAKCALGAATNSVQAAINGTLGTEDTSATMPTDMAKLWIGTSVSGGFSINAAVRKIIYLPRRMTNAELQALTGA